ncbi:MAG: hypothetical protein JNL79_33425 [Myxococcales bacterium]|nr:hypothetical protein [Myxococcales bacterium]
MRALLFLAVGAASCGGRTTEPASAETGIDASAVEAAADTPPPPVCPATPPTVLSACTPLSGPESFCSYGDDPVQGCREVYVCTVDHIFEKGRPCSVPTCPTVLVDGAPCTREEAFQQCGSASGTRCVCGGTEFRCKGPPGDPRCPTLSPNSGAKCAVEGVSCDYTIYPPGWADVGPVGFVVDCKSGLWQWRRIRGGP